MIGKSEVSILLSSQSYPVHTKRRRNPLPHYPSRLSLSKRAARCLLLPPLHCRPFLLSRRELFTERRNRSSASIGLSSASLRPPIYPSASERAAAGESKAPSQGGRGERNAVRDCASERMDREGRRRRGGGPSPTNAGGYETPPRRRARAGDGRSLAPSPLAKNPSGGARFPRAFLDSRSRRDGVRPRPN